MNVGISGTFNVLHRGHKSLFDKAFQTAGKNGIVFIGVTEGEMLQKKKNFVKPYRERVHAIKKYLSSLSSKRYDIHFVIIKICDKYGPAAEGDYDAIVVSPETVKNAEEINKKRIDFGKKPLKIVKIPYVLAEDDKPISSTRILNKEIDKEGRVLD